MNIKKIFRGISSKLQADFKISSEINHQGAKGTYRESSLRDFLQSGRLPKKFGIGTGEIIGPARAVSKQSDLIIYDQLEGIPLVYNDDIQVYPIESVFGVIEVKSKLSKTELIKSLENIKSVKSLCPDEKVTQSTNPFMRVTYKRPKPFGIVFAYALANNSLESLCDNLLEWENENLKEHRPNLIVIIDEGIILHMGNGIKNTSIITNDELENSIRPIYFEYKSDSLFHFYSALIELCSGTHLGSVNLKRYFDPVEILGNFFVKNHDRFRVDGKDTLHKLSLEFIEKMVSFCKSQGKISHRDLLIKQCGSAPNGIEDEYLDYEVYHYDPDNLPGIHEVENPFTFIDGIPTTTERLLTPSNYIEINNETYYFPLCYIESTHLEEIENSSLEDL